MVVPGNIFDNWDLYHYANGEKYLDVVDVKGGLEPGSQNVIFFSPDTYPTGWLAKECLALPKAPPVGFWTFRQEDEVIAIPEGPADSQNFNGSDGYNYGQLQGGGIEWTSVQPFIPVTRGRPFTQIPIGIRPSGFTINCSIFGIL